MNWLTLLLSFHSFSIIAQIQTVDFTEYSLSIDSLEITKDDNEHPKAIDSYEEIGLELFLNGEFMQASVFYQKDLNVKLKKFGLINFEVEAMYDKLGLIFKNQNLYEKSLEFYLKSLYIRTKLKSNDHPSVADTYNKIGLLYFENQQYENALECQLKCLKIRLKSLDRDHLLIGTSYGNIGDVFLSQENYEKTLVYYQKELTHNLRIHANSRNITSIYDKIGSLHRQIASNRKELNAADIELKKNTVLEGGKRIDSKETGVYGSVDISCTGSYVLP